MKKKGLLIPLLALIIASTSGCEFPSIGSTESLMHPPKASGDKAEIQTAIEEQANTDYILSYPQGGENRSSIIMKDLDGDENDEAIALLTLNPNTEDAESHIYVIDETKNSWKVKGDFKNAYNSIDRIDFGDVNGDSKTDILVGWNTYNVTQHNLYCYIFGDEIKEVNTKETYTSLAVGQFTDEEKSTIFTASLATPDTEAKGKLLSISDKNVVTAYETPMDSNIIQLSSLTVGMVNSSTSGVFVDGFSSTNTYNTQVLFFRNNRLCNPLLSKAVKGVLYTDRDTSTISTDIDNDGIVEIPVAKQLPFSSQKDKPNTAYETVWSNYNGKLGTLTPKKTVIINENYNYHIDVPDEWLGNYTASFNGDSSVLTFRQAIPDRNGYTFGNTVVEYIATLTKDWVKIGSKQGYTKMQDIGIYTYGYKLGESSPFIFSKDDAQEAFVPKEETENVAVSPANQ